MNLSDIVSDAISYPTKNFLALIVYLLLGLLVGIVAVAFGLGGLFTGALDGNAVLGLGFGGIIGLIIIVLISLLMTGFSLDVIKFGINRRQDAPGIDLGRQIVNGVKYLIVSLVYFIIPVALMVGLSFILGLVGIIIGIIVAIIFAFAFTMAICRLADTDSLGSALSIGEAIGDLNQIGVGNVIITLIVSAVVGFIIVFALSFILGLILAAIGSNSITAILVPIVASILDAWLLFYLNRVMGLLYSTK